MNIEDIKNFLENEPLIKQLKLNCELPTKQKCNQNLLNFIMLNCNNIIYSKNELIYLIRHKKELNNLHIFCKICGHKNSFVNNIAGYKTYCCTKCALQDENIINKMILSAKSNIDENGKNSYQRGAQKTIKTKRNDIDENGLDCFQRSIRKATQTKQLDIDRDGLNGFQRAGRKAINTKRNNIDENGLNSIQRGTIKIVQKRRNNINEDGLDSYQQGARKGVITKKLTVDENGNNVYDNASIKAINTKRNNIDENGLDGIQRAIKKGHKTNLIRIGVENPFASKDPELNGQATKERKYNNRYYTNREQAYETCYKNNGVKSVFSLKVVHDMGIEAARKPEIRRKAAKKHFVHYGVEYTFQRQEFIKNRFLELFHVDNYSKTQEFKDLWKNEDFVASVMQKQYDTKKKNNSFCISSPEDIIYQALVYKFDFEDIEYQYKNKERYNFMCDFYIKSLDLFIEINFDPSHGKEPFDPENIEHIQLIEKWKQKVKKHNLKSNKKSRYQNFIDVWTITDPIKFQIAKQNNLNYLVFYNWEQFFNWYK